MGKTNQYNYCLDFIKGIACIFVVFMHCEFPGLLGTVVQAVSRFCVPFFFMVSGYFYFSPKTINKLERIRKAKHLGIITFWSTLFYIIFAFVQHSFQTVNNINCTFKDVSAFLFCNQMWFVVSQMWFLFALLYVYVALVFINPEWYRKHCHLIVFFCLTAYICLAQGLHIIGVTVPNYVYKNWMIEGFGFFSLGFVLHIYKDKFRVTNALLFCVVVSTTLLCLAERALLGRDFGVNVCSIPQSIALMLYALNNSGRHKGIIQLLGKTCSMFVYILHPAVWHTMEKIYQVANVDENMVALYVMPIIVLAVTVLLSIACYRVQQLLLYSKTNA